MDARYDLRLGVDLANVLAGVLLADRLHAYGPIVGIRVHESDALVAAYLVVADGQYVHASHLYPRNLSQYFD